MVAAGRDMPCLVSSWMMSHLGRKPVSGGRPARESSARTRMALSDGIFVHAVINVESFTTFIVFRVRNTVAVIRLYK